jgi:hypothetical protein
MADLKKFEEMLERLVNEDKEGAEELFHEIVVEKSRDIYESLLESDLDDEEVDEASDEEVDESDDEEVDEASDEEVDESDDEDEVNEDFDLDEFEVEADPMAMPMGGDPADDMMGDVEPAGDMDMDMDGDEGEGDVEDRVADLEDALDDLKAEFDKMMAGDEGGDDEGDMDMDMDMGGDEGEEDEGDEEAEEESVAFEADEEEVDEVAKAPKSQAEQMREYVEKVVGGHGAETKGKGEDGGVNKKSTVAGKNDMGGTASNLNQGDTGDVVEAGKGQLKGNALSDQVAKEDNAGNVNVPGAKAGKAQSAVSAGHGAEKKGKPEGADNKKSTIGS